VNSRRPRQRDLDDAFQQAASVRFPGLREATKRRRQVAPLYVASSKIDIEDIRDLFQILEAPPGGFVDVMSPASVTLSLVAADGAIIGTIGLVECRYLQWPDRWDAEPPLQKTPAEILAWLDSHGVSASA
jgi:hypothetical protein